MHPDLLVVEATARRAAALGAAETRRHRSQPPPRIRSWQEALGRRLVAAGTSLQGRPLGLRRSAT